MPIGYVFSTRGPSRVSGLDQEVILTTTLKISGMTCPHCVNNVSKALLAVVGVEGAQVNLEEGSAVVTGSADQATLIQAVVDAGYSVEAAS
jgi:copper chaperone CopZ